MRRFGFLVCMALWVMLAACGARTGLLIPEESEAEPPLRDAARDVRDVSTVDVNDASTIDVTSGCDGGVTAYLWDEGANLYTFDPTTLTTTLLGPVKCPTASSAWTLSVSRAGYALMIYEDWNIYHVDLTTLACTSTSFVPWQLGFDVDGKEAIAISRDPMTPEQLYVYGMSSGVPTLAVADPLLLVLTEVGPVTPNPNLFPADMQGDALGHLFVLSPTGQLLELDSANADVIVNDQTTFSGAGSWAIMTYGSQLFFFGSGFVSLEDIATQTLTPLGDLGIQVVGASAAPCVE